ncbi:MAG: glycosyltransferase [Candidatus Eremiobacteraeota bacterium]|nr:glycosyltransferase [Candidatus Eremiobacteraeota bacterium]
MSNTSQTPPTPPPAEAHQFSIIVPARDEERRIGACLASIRAATEFQQDVGSPGYATETVVVLNRCTDRTGQIARDFGARTHECDAKNLSVVRNAGARLATGRTIVTIDADSVMAPNTFAEMQRHFERGDVIGGGAMIHPERMSLGIAATGVLLAYLALRYQVSAGMFWLPRDVFEALGGFDESLVSVEDIDFAVRLRRYGRARRKRFATLWNAPITTSCRKFDHFGDWFVLKHFALARDLLGGRDQRAANTFFYDFPR